MTSGLVVSVSPRNVGDALSAAVSVGATVLPVSDACEFDEEFDEPRYLVIGETLTPLEYIAVENDDNAAQQTVTLAAPLLFSAEADMPVTLWDPSVEAADKRAIVFEAQVLLDGQDDATIPATIEHETVPLAGVYSLEGARVALDDDEGEWFVSRVLGRAAVVDSGVISTPQALGVLNVDTPWPSSGGTYPTIQNFGAFDLVGIDYNSLTGIWRFDQGGTYLIILNIGFSANADFVRGGQIMIHYLDGSTSPGGTVKVLPVEGQTALQVVECRQFFPGQGVSMGARQNSGQTLTLLGANGDLNKRDTSVSIVRVAV